MEGDSRASEADNWGNGEAVNVDPLEARRVELVASDEVVASSPSSITSHVCKVASGAKDTRRFARMSVRVSDVVYVSKEVIGDGPSLLMAVPYKRFHHV